LRHWRGVDIGDLLHRMRIAHRQRDDIAHPPVDVQRPETCAAMRSRHQAFGIERHVRWLELRRPHVDGHVAVGFEHRLDHAGGRLHADRPLVGQAARMDELDEAARAIAAGFHLVAIGIEDAVLEVHRRRIGPLHQQDLIGADTEAAISQQAQLRAIERKRLGNAIEHHEVVAGALHLGEAQSHAGIIGHRRRLLTNKQAPHRAAAS
jgi:hypothetical protein